jgi:hypothetical protein
MSDVINRGVTRPPGEADAMAALAWMASEFVAQSETFPVFIAFMESMDDADVEGWTLPGLRLLADLWAAECVRRMNESAGNV